MYKRQGIENIDWWIKELYLTNEAKRFIVNGEQLCDQTINSAMILIMKQMPHFRIQSSTFTHEFLIYSGTESIHVHHNGNNHFINSSSIGKKVRVFDSINTKPTEELYKQIIAIYSPDDATPEIFQQIMHQEQRGVTDLSLIHI